MTTATPWPATTRRLARSLGILAIPLALWVLLLLAVSDPLRLWVHGQEEYDVAALKEWLEEARGSGESLPELVRSFLARVEALQRLPDNDVNRIPIEAELAAKRGAIAEHLQLLGLPATRLYAGQLPLFPTFYRLEVRFLRGVEPPIAWDSALPTHPSQYQELQVDLDSGGEAAARIVVRYQLHAYNKRQATEHAHRHRLWVLALLALTATGLGVGWAGFQYRRDLRRDKEQRQVEDQAREAERLLLQQRLATQAAEQKALELKSQLYASIGIMAGSYAHNIKNLLVRPNDLLNRCLELGPLAPEQTAMLQEVQQTLGTVTERLQQILTTVRRNPGQAELTRLDLNVLAMEVERTWRDLARDRWKMEIVLDLEPGSLWIEGDPSHLMQAIENLMFNARDATYEMRSHLRELAHNRPVAGDSRKQALIAAAGWRGRVVIRTRRLGERIVLEVSDNGIGMSEEVRQHCTEAHFTTKRDSAIHAGNSTGMGLGLSFVTTILEQHDAILEIESEQLWGATFRAIFPAREPLEETETVSDKETSSG
jgi:signal transduction histidine kinase